MTEQLCPHISTATITYSVQGRRIFRDECLKCYDNTVSLLNNIQ